ncbi:MAG: RagB/SusD family nutrient uptake outer membrane protein [Tannerellaceae bacterium]
MNNIIKSIGAGCLLSLSLTSCNDSFMERYPETDITDKVFFQNVKDLELYTNGLYSILGSSYNDVVSDNVMYVEDAGIFKMMRGETTPETVGLWEGWDKVRNVNFMLEHVGTVVGDQPKIDHYVGLARMFRAIQYYGMVKKYSDLPWYSRTIQTTDEDLLYKTQDPRTLVVDSIMADLQFAVDHIEDGASKTRVTLWSALMSQARIALYEGTFRKYHDELNLQDGNEYLKVARDAAKRVIDSGKFDIYTAQTQYHPYEALFISEDLSQNPEMIMFADYDKALGRMHNAQAMINWTHSMSRDLMEDYLIVENNEAIPYTESSVYGKQKMYEVFENRDPRITYTFMQPGFTRDGYQEPERAKMGLGGYCQIKFIPRSYDQFGWGASYTDLPIYRYAEALLIYAEARAELGELTQDDLDITVNKLRDRVNMPHMKLANVLAKIDPRQEAHYPNVDGAQKGAILEIRRERRIELACEGQRYGDLMRWKVGENFANLAEGLYVDKLGYQDITGDNQPDIAIVATQADADAIPAADKEKYKLTVYVLDGNTFSLSEGDHGYIRLTSQIGKFNFISPKYYYTPLDVKDIQLNKNLVQNPFWQ